jgi:hypothetical protein
MSEKLQKSEQEKLLEKLGIYLPKDEEFEELLEREGIGYLIRKDVQESFTPAEIEKFNKEIDEILADLAASPSGLSGNERIISEVLQRESENLKNFVVHTIECDMRQKGYAWKGTTTVFLSSGDWVRATKQVELITQLALIKLARTRGLVPKVDIIFKRAKTPPEEKPPLTLKEAVTEIEAYARKTLGDDYIMVKKRLQKHFSTKEDLADVCSEIQKVLALFIDTDIAGKFENKTADIIYRIQGD